MSRISTLGTLVATALLFLAGPAFAQVRIASVATTGKGCPKDSTDLELTNDTLSIGFSKFSFQGPGTADCAIDLVLQPLPNVIAEFEQVDWRGMAAVEGSLATGTYTRSLTIDGLQRAGAAVPFSDAFAMVDFLLRDRATQKVMALAPKACGAPLTTRTQVAFNLTGAGSFAMPLGEPAIQLKLKLTPCTPANAPSAPPAQGPIFVP